MFLLHIYDELFVVSFFFFFQAEDGIRDVERSRGLGDVYKSRTTRVSVTVVPLTSSGLLSSTA